MFKFAVATGVLLSAVASHPETVYEFAAHCGQDELGPCFNRIEERLDTLKRTEEGRSFCLPGGFGAGMLKGDGFPVSILEHVRVELSAARFGRAEQPADAVISEILGKVYPCR